MRSTSRIAALAAALTLTAAAPAVAQGTPAASEAPRPDAPAEAPAPAGPPASHAPTTPPSAAQVTPGGASTGTPGANGAPVPPSAAPMPAPAIAVPAAAVTAAPPAPAPVPTNASITVPAAPAVAPPSALPSALPPAAPATPPPPVVGTPATVLDVQDFDGILGKSVRSASGEDMGRIIDVIVDRDGHMRAVIIDFGGFLGVGSRKIAVDWRALKFAADGKPGRVVAQLNRNQVRVSPEYKPGEPIVVLGPAPPEPDQAARAAAEPRASAEAPRSSP